MTNTMQSEYRNLPLDALTESPNNPRKSFDEASLNELAESIKTQGILAPLVVRPVDHHFEIVAGARRYRAAQRAGLEIAPVRIVELTDAQALETNIVENLQRRDVRLDAPCQVRLHGKGSKVRLCPIWPATAHLLRDLMQETPLAEPEPADAFLFTSAHGRQMTRFGVRYLLRKYVTMAGGSATTLRDKRIHPHSIRHSTAIALLKAGVDFATISQWLGHASLNTTMRYARADLDLKRQALLQVFPDALAPPRGGHLLLDGRDLAGWLRRM